MKDNSAIAGTRKAIKEMVDGTLRIQIDIEPRYKSQFHELFPDIDMPVAIAPLVPVAEGIEERTNLNGKAAETVMENHARYGQQAKELRLSSFFRRPEVWHAVGTDAEFRDWLKGQNCAVDCDCRLGVGHHGGDVVPAHVRRVANGSGTGIKPDYSSIPLCDTHHSVQHQKGELDIAPREWWDKKRIEYLVKWCWDRLKTDLGYDSWSLVPPWDLFAWAQEHGVSVNEGSMWLPRCYYDTYPEQP
jgi:hypothetical protein